MTRKLDLRTGRPVWSAYRAPAVREEPLTRDLETDVLVVGMGISGAMIASALSEEGHRVVCIDRRGPLEGSTPATTALVQYEIDQPLSVLAKKIGRSRAERAWRRSRLALASLEAEIEAKDIACDAVRRASLLLAGTELGPAGLHEEVEARRAAGLHSVYLTPAALRERYGIKRNGGILSHGNLALDPRRLTAYFLLAAQSRKARLFAPVEATSFKSGKGGVEVSTRGGPVLSAKHVVLATGYELADGVPAEGHRIISTFAIATKAQKRALWPTECFMWEASDPYLYLRTTADGRVICGGEDEEFADAGARDALIPAKTARISKKLEALHPSLDTKAEFAWAGAFGTTPTGLPLIGPLPGKPRILAIMGYGGNGITWSRIAAELVTSRLAGRTDPDADLFAFKC